MTKTTSLTEGPIASALIRFSIPFLLATLLQSLYGTVDTLAVGNFGSTAGLSAVSTGAEILSLVTYLSIGLANGGTVLLGQLIGAKDTKRAAKVVGNMIIDFAVISFVMMGLMFLIYPTLLRLLNLPEEALPEARNYMKICSLGIPMIIGYNIVCSLLRAAGDSRSPLLFVCIATVVNILGDLLLTAVFPLGAAGVAVATVTAQSVSFLFSLFFIMKRGMPFPFSRKDIRFDASVTAQIFRLGVPMGLQSILINLSFMFITSIINSMGLTASAAMGVGDKITGFAFMPQSSFSQALAVIVAQNVGARQPERAWRSVRLACVIGFCIETLFVAVCWLRPELFPGLFTSDPEVVRLAGLYMKAYGIDALLTSISFCLSGFLNGCGKTTFNMAQNLIATFLGRIPATWLLARLPQTNLFLIGLAAPASTVMTLAILAVYLTKGCWKKGLYEP